MNHSIWIDHREYLEDEAISETNSLLVGWDEELYEMVHNPTTNSLSSMSSSQYNYNWILLITFSHLFKISYSQHLQTITYIE